MPWVLCPACRLWSLRSAWTGATPGFPFRIVCPSCGVASDVAAVPMGLRPPEGVAQKQRTAALALRVYRAVARPCSGGAGTGEVPAPAYPRLLQGRGGAVAAGRAAIAMSDDQLECVALRERT